jgi:hypothetical protein
MLAPQIFERTITAIYLLSRWYTKKVWPDDFSGWRPLELDESAGISLSLGCFIQRSPSLQRIRRCESY